MWKKPKFVEPKFDSEVLKEMSKQKAGSVNGGAVGTCYVAGYTCWSTGGFKVGTCLFIGYACNTSSGGF